MTSSQKEQNKQSLAPRARLGLCLLVSGLMAACLLVAGGAQAAPTNLDMCLFAAETAISDMPIPPEVSMLERKIWIVNESKRWRSSLNELLQSRDKVTRIPDPFKKQRSFDKVILKFTKDTSKRLKVDGCGEELAQVLAPSNANYASRVAAKHGDLDYIIGLADLCARWMADNIVTID